MTYTINENAVNIWVRDNDDTMDLSIDTDASGVYLDNGRTLEQELGEGSMVSNVVTVESAMSKVIDGTLNGAYRECVLEGRTLVNVTKYKERIVSVSDNWSYIHIYHDLLKPSTKYYYKLFNLPNGYKHVFTESGVSGKFLGEYTTSNVSTFSTTSNLSGTYVVLHINDGGTTQLTKEQLDAIDVVICEYQESLENLDLPYFEGICDVKMPILRNVGKNLFDGNFTVGGLSTTNGSYDASNKDWAVTDYINVSNAKGVTFSSSASFNSNNFVYFKYDKNKKFLGYIGIYDSSSIASTSLEGSVYYVRLRVPSTIPNNSKFQIEQGLIVTTYEDHKTNILLPSNGEIKVTEDMFEQGGINGDVANVKYEQCKSTRKDRVRLKEVIPVKPSTHYAIINKTEFVLNCFGFTNRQTNLDNVPAYVTSFVTGNTTDGIALMLCKKDGTSTITPSEIDFKEIQLIEVDKTVTLRSLPNGVKDTLNLMTGECVQRISEKLLNGSESWELESSQGDNSEYTRYSLYIGKNTSSTRLNCDKWRVRTFPTEAHGLYEYICMIGKILYLQLKTERLSRTDIGTFKTWLQSNPITIQYELAEPIIKTINLWATNNNPAVGDIVLPNGVKDEYNAKTGVYTKRVGKMVLDGSENWTANLWSSNGEYFISYFQLNGMKRYLFEQGISLKSDIFPAIAPVSDSRAKQANTEFIATYGGAVGTSKENWLYLSVKASKLSPASSEGIKNYLKQNPVTVWYELAEPQAIQLTPEFAKATPFAYENGHVILESGYDGQSLLPTLDYSTITNRTGQIKSIGEQVLKQDKQINAVERVLLTNIVTMNYSNTLLKLNLNMDEVK